MAAEMHAVPAAAPPSDLHGRRAESLRSHVADWHGLDLSSFGRLLREDVARVSKDRASWQELQCYLFAEMLIFVKQDDGAAHTPPYTLKGSILAKHIRDIETEENENELTLNMSVEKLPAFYLRFSNQEGLKAWRDALVALGKPERD